MGAASAAGAGFRDWIAAAVGEAGFCGAALAGRSTAGACSSGAEGRLDRLCALSAGRPSGRVASGILAGAAGVGAEAAGGESLSSAGARRPDQIRYAAPPIAI